MNLEPFEHRFIRSLQHHFGKMPQRKFLLAVSGGLDSTVGLFLFDKFKNYLKSSCRVIYVHHGGGGNSQLFFRKKSLDHVCCLASKASFDFVTNDFGEIGSSLSKSNEQDLRQYRYLQFEHFRQEGEWLVLFHHLDDLLETRVMDLFRGCHFEHWQDHKECASPVYRPLSMSTKNEIKQYAQQQGLSWVDDPSNMTGESERSWLRKKVFSVFRERHPGFEKRWMKSLTELYHFCPKEDSGEDPLECVSLAQWMLFSEGEKRRFILRSALQLGLKSLTYGQINEVIRNLDLSQGEIQFQTGPMIWVKNADNVLVKGSLNEK